MKYWFSTTGWREAFKFENVCDQGWLLYVFSFADIGIVWHIFWFAWNITNINMGVMYANLMAEDINVSCNIIDIQVLIFRRKAQLLVWLIIYLYKYSVFSMQEFYLYTNLGKFAVYLHLSGRNHEFLNTWCQIAFKHFHQCKYGFLCFFTVVISQNILLWKAWVDLILFPTYLWCTTCNGLQTCGCWHKIIS